MSTITVANRRTFLTTACAALGCLAITALYDRVRLDAAIEARAVAQ
jgi:hypothetical protein